MMSIDWLGAAIFLVSGMITLAFYFLYYNSESSQPIIHRNVSYAACVSMAWILLLVHLEYSDGQSVLYYVLHYGAYALAPILLYSCYIYGVTISEETMNLLEPIWERNLETWDSGFNNLGSDAEERKARDREAADKARELQEKTRRTSAEKYWREKRPEGDNAMRSGYALYDFLEYFKYRNNELSQLVVKEVIWWMEGEQLKCYNTFSDTPGHIPLVNGVKSLENHPSALFVNVVSVTNPADIKSAINLIKDALEAVPYYTTDERSRNQFKYSVAIDCEFLEYPAEFYHDSNRSRNQHPPRNSSRIVDDDRQLVTCMTVCVDKALAVNFHILHMIEHIVGKEEVEQITNIFRDLILDQGIIKLWFNYDNDIKALDATLDEIYRGTPRAPFTSGGDAYTMRKRHPSYKLDLKSIQDLFYGFRPSWLTFRDSSTQSCPYDFHADGVDNFERPCPCRTNNLNLRVVVEFIMRNIGIIPGPQHPTDFGKRSWTEHRHRGSYASFEKCMLFGDKHYKLFEKLKQKPVLARPFYNRHLCPRFQGRREIECGLDLAMTDQGLGKLCHPQCPNRAMYSNYLKDLQNSSDLFFRRFGNPTYQEDPALLGYAIGNVIGLAVIARFLVTTENPRLLLERLALWAQLADPVALQRPMRTIDSTKPERFNAPYQWHETSRLVKTVPLYIENQAFAKQDLIAWRSDISLRNQITAAKVPNLGSESDLRRLVWRFLRANPDLFGDYIVTNITLEKDVASRFETGDLPAGALDFSKVTSDHQYSNDKIQEFFKIRPLSSLYKALLPMLIAYLELKLVFELENDQTKSQDMIRQFDESRQPLSNFTQPDRQILEVVRSYLEMSQPRPSWAPGGFLLTKLQDPNITGNGLFLIPKQLIDFPDVYNNGMRKISELLFRLRDLQSLQASRLARLQMLLSMNDAARGEKIMNATIQGITNFEFPVIQSLISTNPSGEIAGEVEDIAERLDIQEVIQYWLLLAFKTTHRAKDRAKTFKKRVFDLTFSPTNFYMPEFRGVNQPQGGGGPRASVNDASGFSSTAQPPVAPINAPGQNVPPRVDAWDDPAVEARPIGGGGWFDPKGVISANRINFDIDNEGLPVNDAPLFTLTPTKNPTKWSKPWWSPHLSNLRKIFHSVNRDYKKGRAPLFELKNSRNLYFKAIQKAKSDHWNDFVAHANSQDIWALKAMATKDKTQKIPSFPNASSPKEVNQAMVDHFFPPPPIDTPPPPQSFFNNTPAVTQAEVQKALAASSNNSAPGPDTMPCLVWKKVHKANPSLLPDLLSPLLAAGHHPASLKKALGVVLPKPGKPDYNSPTAYRIIVLLETVSKILERIVTYRLAAHARATGLLHPHQTGSIAGLSTADAATTLMHEVRLMQRANLKSSTLFLDIKGGFDNVIPAVLATTLKEKDTPNYMVQWVLSFLTDRSCTLLFPGSPREPKNIKVGVPQGSPISPLLFCIYVSALHVDPNPGITISYVDDFAITVGSSSYHNNIQLLQAAFRRAETTGRSRNTTFSLPKTELIHWRTPRDSSPVCELPIQLGPHRFFPKPLLRWVGFWFSPNFDTFPHYSKRIASANASFAILRQFSSAGKGLTAYNNRKLATMAILPMLTYGASVFVPTARALNRMTTCWHSVLRWVTNCFRSTPISSLSVEAAFPPLALYLPSLMARYACRILQASPAYNPVAGRTSPSFPLFSDFRVPSHRHLLKGKPNPPVAWDSTRKGVSRLPIDQLCSLIIPQLRTQRPYEKLALDIKMQVFKDWHNQLGPNHRPPSTKPMAFTKLPRFISGRLHQMRTGKSYLAAHPSWFNKDDPTTCQHCLLEDETLEHAILSCPSKSTQRQLFIPAVTNLDQVWDNHELSAKLGQYVLATRTGFPTVGLAPKSPPYHLSSGISTLTTVSDF